MEMIERYSLLNDFLTQKLTAIHLQQLSVKQRRKAIEQYRSFLQLKLDNHEHLKGLAMLVGLPVEEIKEVLTKELKDYENG